MAAEAGFVEGVGVGVGLEVRLMEGVAGKGYAVQGLVDYKGQCEQAMD